MVQAASRFEDVLSGDCRIRPADSAAAQESDQCGSWKRFALKAIDGGYFRSADDFVLFVDACLRHLSFEQVRYDRAYAHAIRNLADAIAQRWARGTSPQNAPGAEEIAGLLQSEWVRSGQFRSLPCAIGDSVAARATK